MKSGTRAIKFCLAILLAVATLSSATSAKAGPGLPGHWHGTPDPDSCNTFNDCIYIFTICYQGGTQTLGSHDPSQLQHELLVELIGAKFGACVPLISHSGRCKLTDIDEQIGLGSTFSATWLGKISSLRFRNSDGFIVFVTPVPGSVYFSDGKANALFTLSDPTLGALLGPGNYKVSCFGEEGTVGGEIKVTVSR